MGMGSSLTLGIGMGVIGLLFLLFKKNLGKLKIWSYDARYVKIHNRIWVVIGIVFLILGIVLILLSLLKLI